MKLNLLIIFTSVLSMIMAMQADANDSDLLDNVSLISEDLGANDVVYDRVRDVIYASIGSDAGLPNGNSVVALDPESLEVLNRFPVGSEPSKLAISSDCSRVYVGLNGALAIRYFEPATGILGPIVTLDETSIAEDIEVAPSDPTTVIVASDEVGSSAAGFLEIFNDTGRVGTISSRYSVNSISFLDSNTLFGYANDNTGFDSLVMDFDGSSIPVRKEKGRVIAGFGITVEASGGLIFATSGRVLNPKTMSLTGSFVGPGGAIGAIEPSARDGLVYFLDEDNLKVYDLDSYLELDSVSFQMNSLSETEALEFAGTNRLAFVDEDGTLGVISGVVISEKPTPQMTVRGTAENDECVFDAATRRLTINGDVTQIPYEVNRLFFNGLGGDDSLRFVSDENADEYAVLKNGSLVVDSERTFFSAFNMEDVRFEADELSNDISVVFDSADDETIFVRPNKLSMATADGSIETNNRGRTIVYSSGNGDRAVMRGGPGDDLFRVNFGQRRVQMTGEQQSVELNGFDDVYLNAGLDGNDRAIVFDSQNQEFFYSFGDLNRLSNADGVSYVFKGFDYLSVASLGGNDIALLQKTATSQTRGNSRWSSIYDTFFDNNVFNFFRVDIRD